MKKLMLSVGLALATYASEAQSGLACKMPINPADLGGLSMADYLTNFVMISFGTSNVTTPTNQWPVINVVAMTNFTANVAAGIEFSNNFAMPTTVGFYMVQFSNYNGQVGPFSLPAAYVPRARQGTVRVILP